MSFFHSKSGKKNFCTNLPTPHPQLCRERGHHPPSHTAKVSSLPWPRHAWPSGVLATGIRESEEVKGQTLNSFWQSHVRCGNFNPSFYCSTNSRVSIWNTFRLRLFVRLTPAVTGMCCFKSTSHAQKKYSSCFNFIQWLAGTLVTSQKSVSTTINPKLQYQDGWLKKGNRLAVV